MADASMAVLLLLPLLWILAAIVLLQARHRRKEGRRLWEMYRDAGRRS